MKARVAASSGTPGDFSTSRTAGGTVAFLAVFADRSSSLPPVPLLDFGCGRSFT
jgi:hypothetical protein